jgi:hypothetical protein
MTEQPGPFDLPEDADESGMDDQYGLSLTFGEDGDISPTITVPQGDLEPSEHWPAPGPGNGTTPFDPDHNPVDKAIWDANHPDDGGVQLPYNPDDPLHLGILPGEQMFGAEPDNYGPGDYVQPTDDPAVADADFGTDDVTSFDAFA